MRKEGIVVAECHPSGLVRIDGGAPQSALAEHGHFIAEGTAVVVGMQFGELIVRAHDATRIDGGAGMTTTTDMTTTTGMTATTGMELQRQTSRS